MWQLEPTPILALADVSIDAVCSVLNTDVIDLVTEAVLLRKST